ncbi:hypothetical protein HHK36_000884 [Tetracentron sinense]|uniref:PGG domain-containing protein n=1 Tax=Tetracentron sinense TaxID=13715 RepID=A0A835A2L7_TETSI|nr:hypothetical protein HHK36_000884 [Tetracentron sinense]
MTTPGGCSLEEEGAIEPPPLWRMENREKNTALHEALRNDGKEVALFLLDLDTGLASSVNEVMDQRLILVAQAGDINALYTLLRKEPSILESIDRLPFIDTPLHIAVLSGKISFAMEIANLKPSFTEKLNQDGLSPIHLASTMGDMGMVKELLTIGRELCLLKGREKRTPLHVAVIFGRIDVINELINQCPKSLEELTVHKESVLHIALKYEQLDTFKLLLDWVKELNKKYIVNLKDKDGNTVLHLATSRAIPQANPYIINELLRINCVRVKVNAMNANNQTALDVLLQLPGGVNGEIQDILHRAKAKRGDEIISTSPPLINQQSWVVSKIPRPLRGWKAHFRRAMFSDYSIEVRSALLVVAALTATATFQAGVNPPGGVWQDNFNPNYNNGTTIFTPSEMPHEAGTAIMATNFNLFIMFTFCNISGFLISDTMIFILTTGLPFSSFVRLALAFMGLTYVFSLMTTIPYAGCGIPNLLMIVLALPMMHERKQDILLQLPGENGEIQDILRRAKAKQSDEITSKSPPLTSHQSGRIVSKIPGPLRGWKACVRREMVSDYSMEVQSVLLVVAVLIATATFQTGINPRGGVCMAG